MAIEDAACLARTLLDEPDLAAAFAAYESARLPRTAYVGRQSRRIGAIGQFENRWVVHLRDRIARTALSISHNMTLNSVYSYKA